MGAAEHYDADVFFYSGEIDHDGYGKLVSAVTGSKSRKNVLLILVTNGGSANAAYQIARFLQKTYYGGVFKLCIPSYCKSAGTLIALGAEELLMDTFSELGPLDVQLLKQDEIGTRRSGLLSRSTFEALEDASFGLFEHLMLEIKRRSFDLISFKLAAEVSSNMVGDLMAPVFSQISPDVVGSDWRDLQVAFHYGIRLAAHYGNAPALTVRHLIEHYPSHDFVIDNEEAEGMFVDVNFPSEHIYSIMKLMLEMHSDSAYNEDPEGIVMALTKPPEATAKTEDDADGKDAGAPLADGRGQPRGSVGMDENGEGDRPGASEPPGPA